MSNIFDALQRAEAESSGAEGPGLALATELLRSAEQRMRESALNAEQQPGADAFDANPPAPATEDMEGSMRTLRLRQPRTWSAAPCCLSRFGERATWFPLQRKEVWAQKSFVFWLSACVSFVRIAP